MNNNLVFEFLEILTRVYKLEDDNMVYDLNQMKLIPIEEALEIELRKNLPNAPEEHIQNIIRNAKETLSV